MTKEAQYLLASVVESSQDSIVTIDLGRTITSWNKGAERMYGYAASEVIGRSLTLVMLPKDIQDLMLKVESIIHEVTVPIYETVRIHKNGRQADLEILLSPVRDALGHVVGVSTVARDISIRKMNEQRKDEFISVASHELKTPVTSIKIYTEAILERIEDSGDEEIVSMVKKLDTQVERLVDLIKALLDTTKLAAGELLLNIEPFDLNSVIKEQIETFDLVSDKHSFTFTPDNLKIIQADRKLIGQVLTNLITNACKYSPKGGEIILTAKEAESGIEVGVQDFGIGISKEVSDKIFERYFRVGDPVIAGISGIGLGLYITAEIIRQHGGTISVQSEEGVGSKFSFTLPYDRMHNASLKPA